MTLLAAPSTLGTNRSLRRAIASIAVLATGILGWAAYAPVEFCSDPACARERFRIFVEVDSFHDSEPLALEASDSGHIVTPASILELGGIRVQIAYDQTDLPYAAASGPLTPADLRQYTEVWRGHRLPADVNAGLYAMLTPALVSETGERLFGVMFDMAGREGFAVAPGETARLFKEQNEEWIALLQLRTFTHELLHSLNRQHLDAAHIDGRLTIEAPTHCISAVEDGRWLLKGAPFMSISAATIRFFQTAPARDVLPGVANKHFEQLRTSATECDDARRNVGPPAALSRWELMKRRLSGISFIQAAHAENGSVTSSEEPVAQVEIRIQVQDAAYPLGYPIAVRLMVLNSGTRTLPLRARLAPAYGIMQVERRAEGEEDWVPFKPVVLYEPESDMKALLASSEATEETVPIFFGSEGWTFPRPGTYEVRARLHLSEDHADATSGVVRLRIEAPETEDDQAVLQTLLDERGQLDENIGRLLTIGGRIGFETDISSIAAISKSHRHTALGSSLQLILASQRLNPPIDPRTGVRPNSESAVASELLRETCSDSGVAALAYELLERIPGAARAMTPVVSASATAWDGLPDVGAPFATYSDPTLQHFGPSLHFCSGDSTLTGSTRQGAVQLARRLRQVRPQRIIVIGHGDRAGSCERNDALALHRAQALKRALIDSGIAAERIQTVSLGSRMPLDFSAGAAAHLLNRRVEVLIEGGKTEGDSVVPRVLPECRS